MFKHWGVVFAACGSFASAAAAEKVYISIYENADDAELSDLSLWVDVTDVGGTHAQLEFGNDSSGANDEAVITKILFEKTSFSTTYLGAFAGIVNGAESTGVDFAVAKNFGKPGGDLWNDAADTLYQVDAEPPPVTKGVDPGESLALTVAYAGGSDVTDLISALLNQSFRIAMHVQALDEGRYSVWGVTTTTVVPLPSAAALTGLGLCSLALRRRR